MSELVTQAKLGSDSGGNAHNSKPVQLVWGWWQCCAGSWKHDYRLTFKSTD